MSEDTKKCTKCGKNKPLSKYNKSKRSRDGHKPRCKMCRKEDARKARKRPRTCRTCGKDFRSVSNQCLTCYNWEKGSPCVDCGDWATRKAKYCPPCGKARSGLNRTAPTGSKSKDTKGYVIIKVDYLHPRGRRFSRSGCWVKEHMVVMEQHLGRYLAPGENVHHLNGVRHDNRLENLELWNTSQPSGQRPVDKVKHSVEMIQLYPEHLTPQQRQALLKVLTCDK